MIINLRDLAAKGNTEHIQEQIDISELIKGSREIVSSTPLLVDLQAKHIAGRTDVAGRLKSSLELVCSRCLSQYQEELDISFQESFCRNREEAENEEEDEVHRVAADKVDLRPYVEENVVLELPFIALCKPSCEGLCPVCGTNRNEKACDCKQESIDPRLAGLKDFFKQ
jgi:uncharacterized protein